MDSKTAQIIGNIWLVGSFSMPFFVGWGARTAVIAIAGAWLFYAAFLRRREEKA